MANQNTRQLRKAIAKEFAAARRDGRVITPPQSKRGSAWKGSPNSARRSSPAAP
jgi:hypothetical protein